MPCLGMHSKVMLRFMVQTLQDPLLFSSTEFDYVIIQKTAMIFNDG